MCGLSYAFGGNVLFQYCNVVFLVGAAWLPLAALQLDRLLVGRRLASAVPLGLTMALMVLGGDPQMAYHVVLLGALYTWLLRREKGSEVDFVTADERRGINVMGRHEIDSRPLYRFTANRLVLLGAACLIAAGLAAVQILPSWELNALSERAARQEPRNIYQAAADLMAGSGNAAKATDHWQGLLAKPTGDSHAAAAYEFSVGPWRLIEYLWPNVAGREFPTNRRWMSAIPAEGRVWVPSLYMGLLPLALALAAWRLRRADLRTRWLSWIVLLSVLGSFGIFGLGWLLREVAVHWDTTLVDPESAAVGDPFGGVYWLLTVLLPGYAQFRYPAKWLVVASLGLSVLAVRGWDEVASASPSGHRARRLLLALALGSAACLAVVVAMRGLWMTWLTGAADDARDRLFGPLDVAGAWWDACWAFAQAAVVAVVGWWLVRRSISTPAAAGSRGASCLACAALVLTAIDLGVANRWMIVAAPATKWQSPSAAATTILDSNGSDDQPFRVDRPDDFDLWPSEWSLEGSPTRQRDGLLQDRDTLLPKHALAESIEMLQAEDTSNVLDYQVFLDGVRRWSQAPSDSHDGDDRHASGLEALGVGYVVLPRGLRPPSDGPWRLLRTPRTVDTPAGADGRVAKIAPQGDDFRIWQNTAVLPRAWIVHHFDVLPPLRSSRINDVVERTGEVLFPAGEPRDFRRSAAVEASETGHGLRPAAGMAAIDHATRDHCRIVTREPQRVEMDVEVAQPGGLLVLSDLYYPGWQATVATEGVKVARPAPILRTNRVMRGVLLPPGKHRVTFSYLPTSVIWGAAMSGAAWLALLGLGAINLRRRARTPA